MAAIVFVLFALCYFFGFRPLSAKVKSLDKQLSEVYEEIIKINLEHQAMLGVDVSSASENLFAVRNASEQLTQLSQSIHRRVRLETNFVTSARAQFQLFDFNQARLQVMDELRQLVSQKNASLENGVFDGFPEYSSGMENPRLLWVQLGFVRHILTTALVSGVGNCSSISLQPIRTHETADGGAMLYQVPVRVDFKGNAASVFNFIAAMPLTGEELGAPELKNKPALFISGLTIKKTGANPEEVHLDATISGLFFHEAFDGK